MFLNWKCGINEVKDPVMAIYCLPLEKQANQQIMIRIINIRMEIKIVKIHDSLMQTDWKDIGMNFFWEP